jgi:hypothetical protein
MSIPINTAPRVINTAVEDLQTDFDCRFHRLIYFKAVLRWDYDNGDSMRHTYCFNGTMASLTDKRPAFTMEFIKTDDIPVEHR